MVAPRVRRGDGARQEQRPGSALPRVVGPRGLYRFGPGARRLAPVRRKRPGTRRPSHARAQDGAVHHRVSGLLQLPRRQPVHQLVGAGRVCGLPDPGTGAIRRPRIPHAGLARPSRLLRQVIGRLRRDDSRHEVRETLGRHRESFGRRLFRLLLPHGLAAHAERTRSVSPPSPATRKDRRRSRMPTAPAKATTTAAFGASSTPSGARKS